MTKEVDSLRLISVFFIFSTLHWIEIWVQRSTDDASGDIRFVLGLLVTVIRRSSSGKIFMTHGDHFSMD